MTIPLRLGLRLALLLIASSATSGPARAADEAVLGARLFGNGSTLPSRDTAVSLDLGLDLPTPLAWAVRVDHGLTERWQLGLTGSWIGILGYAGGQTSLQLLDAGSHAVAVEAAGGFFRVEGLFSDDDRSLVALQPSLAYQWHPAGSSAALFVKGGSLHMGSGSDTEFGGVFGDETAEWIHIGKLSAGIEAQLTEHLVASVLGTLWVPEVFGGGRVSLAYAF